MSEQEKEGSQPPAVHKEAIEEEYVPTQEVKEFANEVYEEYKELLESLNINTTNFILIVTKCLERVNKIKKMNDQEKYATTVLILNQLVDEVPDTDETDRYYLKNMVPSLIRIVINASDGKLKLNIKKLKRKKTVNVKQIIEDLYKQIKQIITDNNYTAEYICTNVVVIVGMLMTAVEQYPELTGMEKKAIVIKIFDKLIDDFTDIFPDMDDNLKGLVQHAKIMLPSVIDMLVSVGRNHFQIKAKKCWKWLKGVCKCKE